MKASTADFAKAHLKNVDDATPDLAAKLVDIRRTWEAAFWKHAGLPKVSKSTAKAQRPLTPDEAEQVRSAVKQISGDYATAIYDAMAILVEAGWTAAAQALGVDLGFDVTQISAMEQLRTNLGDFSFMVNDREQRIVNDLVDQALDDGSTPGKLADSIGGAFDEGYHVLDESGNVERTIATDAWSNIVARTELSRAQNMGAVALYHVADVEKVMWVTTEGANVCEICAPADGETEHLGDVFDSVDVAMPPAHPNCACALMAADSDVAAAD